MPYTTKLIAACAIFYWAIALFPLYCTAQTIAEVKVEGSWIRPAVEGQKGTGGFMKLTAQRDLKLVGVSSPVAGVSEVHEMKMQGDMMQMRAVTHLDLPAGKTVELKPGGYHLMLMDLKRALPKDTQVPLTLLFKDKAGKTVRQELLVPVSARAPASSSVPASVPELGTHKH